MWRYSLRWFSGCPAWGHPRLAASHPRGGAWLSAWISSPGSSSVQPTLGPLAPGHCHGTILHQGEAPGPLFPSFLPLPSPCPSPTLRGGQIFGEPPPRGKGRAARSRQTCPVEGGLHAPPPRSSPAPLFLGPLLSIVGCISFPTPSPEKQLGFLQAKPSRLPQSWCVGACTLPNRPDISELSSKWISRLRHVSKGSGGGAG